MSEDKVRELELSLVDAEADFRRTQTEYSTCLLNDPGGCAAEQERLQAAERQVKALRRKLGEARRESGQR